MKHLLTLAALLVCTLSLAQQMPYNPDANGDDFVGVDDVLGVLGAYDTALMQPELTCDYEGTELEALYAGLINQELILDSVYVEYLIVDSFPTWIAGCPEPVFLDVVLERSFMHTNISFSGGSQVNVDAQSTYLGYYRGVRFEYNSNGRYRLTVQDQEVEALTDYSYVSEWMVPGGGDLYLPFPDSFGLSDDGIEATWNTSGWVANSESFRLIPFWHEAE